MFEDRSIEIIQSGEQKKGNEEKRNKATEAGETPSSRPTYVRGVPEGEGSKRQEE